MKTVAKKVLAMFLSLCLVVCSVLLCVHISNESKLNKTWQDALETLTEDLGTYDEKTIVLNNTSRSMAENLADKLDAKLRITSNGSYATLTLQNGMTVGDVYKDRENRALLENFSLDYYSKTSDIEEQETVRQTTAPKYTVSDSLYSYQSYLDYLHIENAWENYRGSGITVAVIDTGIDIDHPEFSGKISEYSYNATEDKIVKDYTLEDGTYDWSLIEDEQGHGTSVAGVIAASIDENGIVGIAPEVTLLIIKAECDEKGNFLRTSDLVFGLYYAIERDADVVNMSFGSSSNVFSVPARLADDSDVTLVAAAGNDSTSELTFPAADENVIGVGALEDGGWNLAAYSNFGDNTDIVAPGTVYTTAIGGGYRTISGTSFASPITAAAVALLKSQNKHIENDSVKELLYASSYDLGGLGKDFYYGYGALDISALILEERGTVTFDMLTDELEDITQIFIRNHTLQNIPEPDRNYAVFDGWYYDIHCTDELNLYSDVWTSDLTLYANWVNEDDGVPYTYVILDDGTVEIRSYTGHRRYITIPDKIENRTVSSIGDFAFSGETRLREVNLPRGLKKIGLNAFANCTNLFSMFIPDGVEEIGANTFANDSRLNVVSIGQNSKLKTIGDFAFQNCGLFNFELPISLENVNGSAFVGCARLTNFSVRKGNKSFIEQSGVLYSTTKSTIIAFPAGKNVSAYTLPDETLTVGTCAFAYAKIKTINLNNVQTINDSAFLRASLISLSIPDGVTVLGKSAFAYNFDLQSLKIGKGLTTIPAGAFKMDNLLVEVTIPKNVQYIMGDTSDGGVFEQCESLTSVKFEENSNLAYIGLNAFAWTNIVKITIPKNVVTIDSGAFEYTFNLSNVSFETGSVLRSISKEAFAYTYLLTNITFPENLDSIGDFAFTDSGLSSVTIPKTVAELGKGAFASCHSLENIFVESGNGNYVDVGGVVYSKDKTIVVEYPAGKNSTEYDVIGGVNEIGNCAFYGAWNLNTVYLPDGVESVGEYAFYDCENVASYSLPETLTAIERYAFSENDSLNYISIPDNVVQISNYAFAYDYNLNTINLSDSSKLPRISFAAFAYTGISSMRIPANVSTIAQYAFTGSNSLQTVIFAANSKLDIVPAYMFKGANNITNITFESGSALTSIAAHGFEGMRRLTSVDFGDAKLTNIDNYAFRYCESLQTVNIPDGVTNIGRFAFYGCKSLARLDLPETIDYIGRFAFYFAENLNVYFKADTLPANLQENWDYGISGYYVGVTDVLESGDWKYATLSTGGISIIKYTGSETILDLTALDLGGEIKQIGGYAFAYSKITSIILPETLEIIQRYAFANSKLESVIIPSKVSFIGQYAFFNTPVKTVTFGENALIYKIEQYAFSYTGELNEFIIPKSVEEIQSYAFYQSGIEIITFEHGVKLTKIAAHAFASSGLISVTIPDSVNYIDDNAFRDCLSLQTVTFGAAKNLQVHANAFYNTAISSLYIPANLEYVGEYAFIGLENLKEYIVADENPYYKSNDGVLYEKDGKKLIAFPAGKIGAFEVPNSVETIGFGAFENTKIESVSFADDINLLTLGYRAFYNAKNLISVSVPDSVISIDYYAFAECRNLESVTFAEDNLLTGIYEGAFLNCISLKNIIIPDSIIEISDYAFYGCSSLTRLPFSETATVKGIYDYAFAYTGIRELIIPETVTDIGAYAFRGSRVKSVFIPDTQKDLLIIGIGALQDCDEIEELDIPFSGASLSDGETRVWFGYIFGAGAVSANATYVPKNLRNIAITEVAESDWSKVFGETSWREWQDNGWKFYNYFSLIEKIVLPEGLTGIADSAFSNCEALTEVVIPETLTRIGESSFINCKSLNNIVIPDSVTFIGKMAFQNSGLTSVTIPKSIQTINAQTFYDCANLCAVVIEEGVLSIGDLAFAYCEKLSEIDIPNSVDNMEGAVFSGCSSLTSITIPESVKSIGYGAFHGCTKLTNVEMSNGITSIGDNAFSECISLTSIKIPNSVTSIGTRAFYGCSRIMNIEIPNSVICIGSQAFQGCSELTYLVISDNVTNIDDHTFDGCSALTSVRIPDKVVKVGRASFQDCSGLINLILSNNLTDIDAWAFNGCNKLMNVKIPASVTSIGDYAFTSCSNLYQIENNSELQFTIGSEEYGHIAEHAKVIVDKNGNKTYRDENDGFTYIDTADGFRFMQEKTGATYKLIAYLGQDEVVTLPIDLNGQEYDIYKMFGVKEVILPEGMTKIADYAFQDCSSLINIKIPSSVKSIGNYAFAYCNGLENIEIPDGVSNIGSSVFFHCEKLTSIKLPLNLTNISNGTFWGCSRLTNIEIPESVTRIGCQAFYECRSLTSINIPNGVTSIGEAAFRDCSNITNLELPNELITIEGNAFSGCSKLINVKIPSSVQYLGANVFSGCDRLIISIDEGNECFKSIDGVIYDKEVTRVVYISPSIREVILPSTVTRTDGFKGNALIQSIDFTNTQIEIIYDSAFEGCSALTRITMPDGVTSIGRQAFYNCSSLKDIEIPDSVTSVGNYAFHNCCGLSNLRLPDGITSIGDGAFYGCIGLTDIKLPDGITNIGWDMFQGCCGLTNIEIPIGVTSIDTNAFNGCSSLINIKIPNGVTSIGGRAFYGCSKLIDIELPDGITDIGYDTFRDCSSLASIKIPDSVISIGNSAFSGCSNLTDIVIPDGVTSIDACAFSDCKLLTSIEIPNWVTKIGDGIFYGCGRLENINISSMVTIIGDGAFV